MIDERYRTYLEEMRALARDSEGREVLVGLTFEETAEVHHYMERRDAPDFPFETGDSDLEERYVELNDKHELARQLVLDAERMKAMRNPNIS